jgi:hypothetical protein
MVCAAYTLFFKCFGIERIARQPLISAVNLNQAA